MKKILLISTLSLLIFFSAGAVSVHAQPAGGVITPPGGGVITPPGGGVSTGPKPATGSTKLSNPFKGGDTLFAFIQTIISDILMPIAGILAVLAFIYSGFLYVTAQGNTTKLADAHRALLYTAIGTAVLLGAWTLATVVCNTIGQIGSSVICPSQNLPSRSLGNGSFQVQPGTVQSNL